MLVQESLKLLRSERLKQVKENYGRNLYKTEKRFINPVNNAVVRIFEEELLTHQGKPSYTYYGMYVTSSGEPMWFSSVEYTKKVRGAKGFFGDGQRRINVCNCAYNIDEFQYVELKKEKAKYEA